MAASNKTIQIYDGCWYKASDYLHECCSCGLTHDVEFELKDGILFMRWTANKAETRKARRARKV